MVISAGLCLGVSEKPALGITDHLPLKLEHTARHDYTNNNDIL